MKKKVKIYVTPEITDLKDMLEKSAIRYAKRNAFKLKDEQGNIYGVTYTEFYKEVKAMATYFIDCGYTNKRIAVTGVNSYNWALTYLAAAIVGTVVPIDKELHSDDIINFLNSSEAVCIVADDKNMKELLDNKDKILNKEINYINIHAKEHTNEFLSFNLIKKDAHSFLEKGDTRFDEIKIDPNEMKILIFTSGTTGSSKGVCICHRNLCSNLMSTCKVVKVKPNDTLLSILPLHHTYECTLGFLLPIYKGACITYCDGLRHITKNISEYHPSVVICVPLLLENMHKKIMKNITDSLGEKYKDKEGHILDQVNPIVRKVIRSKVKNSLRWIYSFIYCWSSKY